PKELLGRFLRIGENQSTLVPLDDLIAANLASLFPGMEEMDHPSFRGTVDTDYDVSDEADDLMQAVEEELRRRRFGEVVRLEVESGMGERLRGPRGGGLGVGEVARLEVEGGMGERLRDQLVAALGIEDYQLYQEEGLLDLSDLWDVVG